MEPWVAVVVALLLGSFVGFGLGRALPRREDKNAKSLAWLAGYRYGKRWRVGDQEREQPTAGRT